jgi:hypothetical protein
MFTLSKLHVGGWARGRRYAVGRMGSERFVVGPPSVYYMV